MASHAAQTYSRPCAFNRLAFSRHTIIRRPKPPIFASPLRRRILHPVLLRERNHPREGVLIIILSDRFRDCACHSSPQSALHKGRRLEAASLHYKDKTK